MLGWVLNLNFAGSGAVVETAPPERTSIVMFVDRETTVEHEDRETMVLYRDRERET